MTDDIHQQFLQWRGVEDPCLRCKGSGLHQYGSGATWRGGMGAASITLDVCDACWGTGDRYRTGCDLRRLRDEEQRRIAECAVDELARTSGAKHSASLAMGIMRELDRAIDRRREPPDVFTSSALIALRNVFARAIGSGERR